MKLEQVCHASSKMGKGRLAQFSPKCRVIIPLSKKKYLSIFKFAPFGYDMSANEGTIKLLAKFGAISPSPQK